jgi:hypothetical protein
MTEETSESFSPKRAQDAIDAIFRDLPVEKKGDHVGNLEQIRTVLRKLSDGRDPIKSVL